MNRKYIIFTFIVILQAVFLVSWAGYHEFVRRHGEVVLLRTRPYDPRDIVRGDYINLNYDISNVPCNSSTAFSWGQKLYVTLEKRGAFYEAIGVSSNMPPMKGNQRFVIGEFEDRWQPATNTVRVAYGIEQFYVPEGKGVVSSTNITVQATLSSLHRLNIKQVFVDGKPYP